MIGDKLTKKHFKHKEFNTTEQIKDGGILSKLTGKNDLIFLKNKWQTLLDNSYTSLYNMSHYIETSNDSIQTIVKKNEIAKLRGSIHDNNIKCENLYHVILNAVKSDREFSERMWKIHQSMYENSNVSKSCGDSVNITHEEVKKYVETYPKTNIKNEISEIKILENENEIKKSEYRSNIAELRDYFEQFKLELIKLESKYEEYETVFNEANLNISNCKFKTSFWYSKLAEKQKNELEISTIEHHIKQIENVIEHYKKVKKNVEDEINIDVLNIKKATKSEFEFNESIDDREKKRL